MDDFFPYVDGVMCADGVPLDRIAAAVGTPVYVYSTAALTAAYRAYADAFAGLDAGICYASRPTATWRSSAPWAPSAPGRTWSRAAS